MRVSEQLRAAGVPTFPCWARFNPAKNRWDKGPAVPRGESWKQSAQRPFNDPALDWSSNVIGVPIPAGVLVLDLDTYKGVTRQAVEQSLGASLPWDRALIQRTIGGGEHYAFACDFPAIQADSLGVQGFDTRVAGKGFICSGQGYTPAGFGLFAMAHPEQLPALPSQARSVLERHEPDPVNRQPATLPDDSDRDTDGVLKALEHIDPACPRAEWVKVGLALRHYYHDDEPTGLAIFDRWSAGDLWAGEPPHNYVPEHVPAQWSSFKAEGATTIATLFYRAIQCGWQPPANFDTSMAFGPDAAGADVFNELVERVRQDGCDIRKTQDLVDSIRAAGCNALQVALLAAELKTELKAAGLKDKSVGDHLDNLLATRVPADFGPPGVYGKSDPGNAAIFLDTHYPGGRLIRSDGEFYAYTGRVWEKLEGDQMKHQVATEMTAAGCQGSKINACIDLVSKLAPVQNGGMNKALPHLIVFNNGVLDTNTGHLHPHSQDYKTTVLLPYDYNPGASCPEWMHFLNSTLDGDGERIALLQEWFGYLLTADYRHHKIMMMLGPKRCGKGTIGRVLEHIVGDANFSGGSLSSFARDSFLDGLRNRPVLFIGDAEKKVPPAKVSQVIERIKSISGNDAVDFDRKYLSGMSDTLPTRITIATNSVPALFDDSGALASRMLLLPFHQSFYGREDLGLIDRLLPELPGIATWALEGLRRLQYNGRFIEPAASREELDYIVENYSPLVRFINEHCITGPGQSCTSSDLYDCYRAWSVKEQEDVLRPKTFVSSIKDATRGHGVFYGVQRSADGVSRGFTGIAPAGAVPSTASAFEPTVVGGFK